MAVDWQKLTKRESARKLRRFFFIVLRKSHL